MDEGRYKFPSTYTKVEVLLLCWEQSCTDVATKDEVDDLKAIFENLFNYHAEIKYLDTTIEQRLQIRVNAIVANFVNEHDGPNTLLIVYYAGHGRPGGKYGNLELFGQTSPNDKKKCIDGLVWNKTEKILMPAKADVLEISDCCYAGQFGLRTKVQRSFEYLAATEEMGSTEVPGDDSFTRALICALEALVKERADGRFTTVELLNKIKDAPQFPMFFYREKKRSAGRIMLHPLKGNGSDVELSRREAMAVRRAKVLQARVRKRRESMRLQQATPSDSFTYTTPIVDALDPLTPSSLDQHSPRITEDTAKGSPDFGPADTSVMSLSRPLGSTDESDGHIQDHRQRPLSLPATTMQALHTSIKCRLVRLSSLCWSLGSRMFESYVRRWEPLKDPDKVRIRWRCRCGTMLWDDFRELRSGAAEDLRACLNFYESTMNSQRTNNLALGGNAAGSVARMPVSSYAAASDQSSTVDAAEGGIMTAESPPSNISSLEAKYLLLCFKKPRDTLRLYHLSVENVKNDFQLFQLLRQTYQTYRGLSGRLFSPRHVRSIAFRKLERHPRERVVIRLSPDIIPSRTNPDVCHKEHVPKCDTEYDIHPGFPDLDPYVGRNGLEHLLNYPHEAEEQGNNLPIQGVWLKRFPKKERSKLNVCPPYQYGLGWGVEFEETWNVSWILKITLLGCVLPATVFLVCWWSIRGDVQGATGMAALLISYCVLLITLISGFAVA